MSSYDTKQFYANLPIHQEAISEVFKGKDVLKKVPEEWIFTVPRKSEIPFPFNVLA